MKLTILGSGTSIGIPVPTCECEVCQSHDPKDNRLRCSALLQTDRGQQILIDCGPDMRQQALRAHIMHIDALLLTHNHFDHCYGLDDLRPWAYRQPLPTYADQIMTDALLDRWDYIFVHRYPGVPSLELHTLHPDADPNMERVRLMVETQTDLEAAHHSKGNIQPRFSRPQEGVGGREASFRVGDTLCQPIRCFHGAMPILGYRIEGLAYLTDCTCIPEPEFQKLERVDTLVIDALRWQPHPTHFSVEQALEVVARLQPRQTFFTHISHDMGLHQDFRTRLNAEMAGKFPQSLLDTVSLAYDGQVILVNNE